MSEHIKPEELMPNRPNTTEYDLREAQILATTREAVKNGGVQSLQVDDLTKDDLDRIPWSGGPLHPQAVAAALDRAAAGEVDYLAVRSPDGWPVSIGGIDYTDHEGAGSLWMLSTHAELRGLGLGTRLMAEAEIRIKQRGLSTAMLGVEDDNDRARALYERSGYKVCGHRQEQWDEADEVGNVTVHHAEVTLMKKSLDGQTLEK